MRKQLRDCVYSMGLGKPAAALRRLVIAWRQKTLRMRYPSKRFEVFLDEHRVVYAVEDDYSRQWFFPRYAGGRLHEPPVTRLFAQHAAQASGVADVGANLGWFTCLAGVFLPKGNVVSFELDEGFCGLVQRNNALNGLDGAEVVNAAVGKENGVIRYTRPAAAHPGMSLRGEKHGTEVEAPMVSLDEWFAGKPQPSLFKIDVEGAERDVLLGMKRILSEQRPTLFLEVHPRKLPDFGTSIEEVLDIVRGHGYTLYEILDWRGGEDAQVAPLQTSPTQNDMLLATPNEAPARSHDSGPHGSR